MIVKKTIPMKQAFSQEDKTLYLNSDTDRASYQLQFDKGRILNSQGSQIEEGVFLFVMDRDDRVFAVDQLKQWNHSFLLAGGDVIGAGMIEIDDGSVLSISNESGHYCPSTAEMAYVLDFFYKQLEGVNSDLIKYYAHDDAAVGIIKEYTLCCIAGTDPDEENYEDELEDMVNQVIYREEQKSFFSRFGLRPEVQPVRCSGKKAEATHAELLNMNEENIHHQVVPMKTKHAENRFTVFHHPSDNLSHSIEANTLLINL